MAALSSSDAWAVGSYFDGTAPQTLAEHWDGTAWCPVASPDPGGSANSGVLLGVTALSPSNVWAVGYYNNPGPAQTLVEHWDGTGWKHVPSPTPCPDIGLNGVAAASSSSAWAAGGCNKNSMTRTVILHWDGTAWTQVPSPNPGGTRGSALGAVAVTPKSSSSAWAVGSYGIGTLNATQTLILHWDGTAWTQVPSPNPGGTGGANLLNAITALSPSSAWTAGRYSTSLTTNGHTLVEYWNGTAWTQQASP